MNNFCKIFILLFSYLTMALANAEAANRYFKNTGNSSWNNTANWALTSGGAGGQAVPTSADDVFFDSASGDCTIDVNAVAKSISTTASFANTITQGAFTLTVSGNINWVSGTFVGSASAITISNNFVQSGGIFTSTSGTFQIGVAGIGQYSFDVTAGIFNHNNGLVKMSGANHSGMRNLSGFPLWNVELSQCGTCQNVGTIYVDNDFTGTSTPVSSANVLTVVLKGNYVSTSGMAHVQFVGNNNQTVTGPYISAVTINKTGGTLTFLNNITVVDGSWTHTAGTIDWSGFKAVLNIINNTRTLTNATFYDLEITCTSGVGVATAGTNPIVTHNLTCNGGVGFSSFPQTSVAGDVSYTTSNGNVPIILNGNGAQVISGAAGRGSITINKSAGTVSLANNFALTGGTIDLTLVAGTFDQGAFTLSVGRDFIVTGGTFNGSDKNITCGRKFSQSGGVFTSTSGTLQVGVTGSESNFSLDITGGIFNHNNGLVKTNGSNHTGIRNLSTYPLYNYEHNTCSSCDCGGTIYVDNNIVVTSSTSYSGGNYNFKVYLKGNYTSVVGGPHVNFIGSNNQVVSGTIISDVVIDKSGGTLSFTSDMIAQGAWNHYSGQIIWNNHKITSTINGNGKTMTNGSFYDLVIQTTGSAINLGASGINPIVSHNLTFNVQAGSSGSYPSCSVGGDVILNTANGTMPILTLIGTGTQNISGPANCNATININKSSGSVVLGSNLTIAGAGNDLVIIKGELDLNGYNVTIPDLLTVDGKLKLKGNENITVNSVANSIATTNPKFTINAANSTIEFYDSAVTAILTNYSKAYYNLILGASKTHEVATGAGNGITINGAISSAGTSGTRSILRSVANAATTWELTFAGSGSSILEDKVDVKYSTANAPALAFGSQDSGNNTNWYFVTYPAFTWTGADSANNKNWSNTANWSTGVVPGATDVATFVGAYPVDCDMDANVNVKGINVGYSYANTITQGAVTISVGASHFIVSGGTFAGSASSITTTGNFRQEGGIFTTTSGTMTTAGFVLDGGTFNANTGTFSGTTFRQSGGTFNGSTGTFTLSSTFLQTGGVFNKTTNTFSCTSITESGGTFVSTSGNISASGAFLQSSGNFTSTTNTLTCTTMTMTGGVFNGSSGSITLSGIFSQTGGIFTSTSGTLQVPSTTTTVFAVSGGAFHHNNGTVLLPAGATTPIITTSIGQRLYNLTLSTTQTSISGTIYADGNLNIGTLTTFANGTNVFVKGDYLGTLTNDTGTAIITFNGTSDQNFTCAKAPNIVINKSSGNLIIGSNKNIGRNWTHTLGSINWGGFGVTIDEAAASTITNGNFYDLTLNNANSYTLAGSDCVVSHNLSINNVASFAASTFHFKVGGDIAFNDAAYTLGTTTQKIILNGGGAQNTSGAFCGFNLEINNAASSLLLGANLTIGTLTIPTDLTLVAGAIDLNAKTLTIFKNLTVSGGTFTGSTQAITIEGVFSQSAGTFDSTSDILTAKGNITVSGGSFTHNNGKVLLYNKTPFNTTRTNTIDINNTITFYDLTLHADGGNGGINSPVIAFGANDVVTVDHNMEYTTSNGAVEAFTTDNGTINLKGDLLYSSNDVHGGTTVIRIMGNAAQLYTGTTTAILPYITVDTSGSFSPGVATTNFDVTFLNLVSGSFTAPSNTLTIRDGMTTSAGTYTHNSGTLRFYKQVPWIQSRTVNISINNTLELNSLTFDGLGSTATESLTYVIAGTNNMVVNGNLEVATTPFGGYTLEDYKINGGTIELKGNLISSSLYSTGGTTVIKVLGNAAQTYSGVGCILPVVTLDTTGSFAPLGGTTAFGCQSLNLTNGAFTAPTGLLTIKQDLTQTSGTFAHNNGTIKFSRSVAWASTYTSSIDINNSIDFNHLTIGGSGGSSTENSHYTIAATDILNVLGDFNIVDDGALLETIKLNGGTIQVAGNTNFGTITNGGTTKLTFTGSANQTVAITSGTLLGGNVVVDKSAGKVIMNSAMSWNTAAQDVTVYRGGLDINGYNLTVKNNFTVFGTLCLNGVETISTNSFTTNADINANFTISATSSTIQFNNSAVTANVTNYAKTFYNLTFGAGKNHEFSTGVGNGITVNGVLASDGSSTNRSILRSVGNAAVLWELTLVGTSALADKVAVKNSNASPGLAVTATNSLALNNKNQNWVGLIQPSAFTWTAETDNNFNVAGNWYSEVVPTTTSDVVYSSLFPINCTVNTNISVKSVSIDAAYTATVTQSGANTITVGSSGWSQLGGTFTGGSGAITINSGDFTLSGTPTFTSTSGLFSCLNIQNWTSNSGTPVFAANGGSVLLRAKYNTAANITSGSVIFNNLKLLAHGGAGGNIVISGTTNVDGNLNIGTYDYSGSMMGGVISVKRDLIIEPNDPNGNGLSGGSTEITLIGTLDQTITGVAGVNVGMFPSITINKPSGAVNLVNEIRVTGNWNWTAADSLNAGTSLIYMYVGYSLGYAIKSTFTAGSGTYNNIKVSHSGSGALSITDTLKVGGTFTRLQRDYSGGKIDNGAVELSGDLIINSTPTGLSTGSTLFTFKGTGDQYVTAAIGCIPGATLTINKPSGMVILSSNMILNTAGQDLVITDGVLDLAGYNLTVPDIFTVNDGLRLKGSETITVNGSTAIAGTNPKFTISSTTSSVEYYDNTITAVITNLSKTFYNLTFGAGKIHEIATGAGNGITVQNVLASTGTNANRSIIRSASNSSTAWELTLNGSSSLADKVDVKNSDASSGILVQASGSLDRGNNTNWFGLIGSVLNVTATKVDGIYGIGEIIPIVVNFSSAAVVTNTPYITLETGTPDRNVSYSSGSGTAALTFNYTVQAGDNSLDLDYISTAALNLNVTGTIKCSGVDANLVLANPNSLDSISDNQAIVIDGIVPTITSISSSTPNGSYKSGSVIAIRINFSETITVVGTLNVNLDTGGVVAIAAFTGTTATGSYTVLAGHTSSDLTASSVTLTATARDAALNDLNLALPGTNIATNSNIIIDTTAPTITAITSSTANGSYKAGDVIAVRINFSEQITVIGTLNVNLDSGGVAAIAAFTGTTATGSYTVLAGHTSSDLTASSVTLTATARDAALNDLNLGLPGINIATNSNIIIDTTAPTITSITSSTANGSYNAGDVIAVRINFSEPITVVGTLNVNLDSGGVAAIAAFTGTTATGTYTVLAGHTSSDLTASSVTLTATARDAALNNLNLALPGTNIATNSNIIIDTTAPTITSITSSTPNGSYKAGDVIAVRINFSEQITVVGTLNVNLDSGGLAAIAAFTGTTATGSYTVLAGHASSDLTASSVTLTATARDDALNNLNLGLPGTNIATNSNIIIDTTAPTITAITSSTANGSYKAGDVIAVRINFSEQITVVGTLNVNLDSGGVAAIAAFTGTTATGTYTVLAGHTSSDLTASSVTLTATARDAALNDLNLGLPGTNIATGSNIIIDTTAPTITSITSSTPNGSYKASDVIAVRINFSEPITVVGTMNVNLDTGGVVAIAAFTGTTATGTYTVLAGHTSSDLTASSVTLTATARDAALNNLNLGLPGTNIATNSNIVIDTTAPTITSITSSTPNGSYKASDVIAVRINFSEQITVVGTMNVNLDTGGVVAIAAFTGTTATGTYTVLAGHTSSDLSASSVTLTATARDAALNNLNLGVPGTNIANGSNIIIDTTAPTITSITSSTPNGSYKASDVIAVRINFSEQITVVGTMNVNLDTGGVVAIAAFTGTTATGSYTVLAGHTSSDLNCTSVTLTVTARDAALNDLNLGLPGTNIATNSNIIIDSTVPTITSITSSTADGTYTVSAVIAVRINFSETITLTGTMGLNLDSGGVVVINAFTGTTATGNYTVLAGHNSLDLSVASVTVNTTARDAALNNLNLTLPGTNINTNSNIVIDSTLPAITSIQSLSADGYYRAGQSINIRISFSEEVTLSGGTLSVNLSSGGMVQFSAFNNATNATGVYTVLAGENTLTLNATAASLTSGTLMDASTNNTAMVIPATNISPIHTIVIDTTNPLIDSQALGSGNVYLDVTFDEGVYNTNLGTGSLDVSDFNLTFADNGGTATNVTITSVTKTTGGALVGGETTYRLVLSVTGIVQGVETITITPAATAIFDRAGNPSPITSSTGAVTLFDQTSPTITNVTSSKANGSYKAGTIIDIQITFTEVMTVTGTPSIKMANGGAGINAFYVSGSSTNTLVFNYIVLSGDNNTDLDYMATTSLALNGGTIQDAATNNASLVLPTPGATGSLGINKNIIVDTIAPTITSGTLEPANAYVDIVNSEGVYTTGSAAPVTLSDLQLTFNANGGAATGVSITALTTVSGSSLVGGETTIRAMIKVSGYASGVETISIQAASNSVFDKAGNAMLTTPNTGLLTLVKMGTTPVIVKVYGISANGTYGNGQSVSIAVQFSEDVTVTGLPFLLIESGLTDQKAIYTSKLNANTLIFVYQVVDGDTSLDLDYVNTSSLISGLNLINSALSIPANLTLPAPGVTDSLGFSSNIVIDTSKPKITSITTSAPNGTYGINVVIPIQINLNRNVSLSGGNLSVKLNSGAIVEISSINGSVINVNYVTAEGEQTSDLNITSLTLSSGATLKDAFGNDMSLTVSSSNLASLYDIKINAKPLDFVISSSAGENGLISPEGDFPVTAGSKLLVNITPLANFHVEEVIIDGNSVGAPTSYTFEDIQSDHTIAVTFAANTGFFDITSNASLGGSITPLGINTVAEGQNSDYLILSDVGYHIVDVIVDGKSVGAVSTYQFKNVLSNHHIEAIFSKDKATYLITANKIGKGQITPVGHQKIVDGSDATYEIKANSGFHIRDVLVDGVSVGAVSTYTFSKVNDQHQIKAVFEKTKAAYKIAASASSGGSISPNKIVDVAAGKSQTFTFTADSGYHLIMVFVDGQARGAISSFAFTNVNENHTIEAVFQQTKSNYTFASSLNNGGFGATITYTGLEKVKAINSQTFTVTAESGYSVLDIKLNTISLKNTDISSFKKSKQKSFSSVSTYTIENVNADYLIEVIVEKIKPEYVININTQGQGSVDVAQVLTVDHGGSQAFTFLPESGYHVSEVTINGEAIGPLEFINLTDIQSNQDISVIFTKDASAYAIGSSVIGKGSITPIGEMMVEAEDSESYIFEASAGYQMVDLIVDNISLKKSSGMATREAYLFTNINRKHTIYAVYQKAATTYDISTTTNGHGTATNSGTVKVSEGSNHLIELAPDTGYHVGEVIVDGQLLGAITSYEFKNVNCKHEVEVQFVANKTSYQISIASGNGGSATPGDSATVISGDSQLIEFTPEEGFRVLDVLIDNVSQGALDSYLFKNVQKNHTVKVSFTESINLYSIQTKVIELNNTRIVEISAVEEGGSVISDYKPAASQEIVDVKVDGVSYGIVNPYTFTNVSEDHQIEFVAESIANEGPLDFKPDEYQTSGGCQYAAHAKLSSGIDVILLFIFVLLISFYRAKKK